MLFDLAWVGGRLRHDVKEAISMAKRNIDPVLQQLVRAINESGRAATPITVSVHGTMLTGALIAERTFFSELIGENPLMSALSRLQGCWARNTPRKRKPPPTITCTCVPPVSGATVRSPKACGA